MHEQRGVGRQAVIGGRGKAQAHAEGRAGKRADNEAQLHVEAVARELLVVLHIVFVLVAGAVGQELAVVGKAVHPHVVEPEGEAGIDAVFHVEGHVEVVLLHAAPLHAAVVVGVGLTGRIIDHVSLGVVRGQEHLRVVAQAGERRGHGAVFVIVEVEPVVGICQIHHLHRLREATRCDGPRADVVFKVAALVIVEAKVDKPQGAAPHLGGIDKAHLVERGAGLVYVVKALGVGLHEG